MLPDLHEQKPPVPISIQEVGTVDIKRYILILESSAPVLAHISCYVDVPANARGAHLSRIIGAVDLTVGEQLREKPPSLLEFSQTLITKISDLNTSSRRFRVNVEVDLLLEELDSGRRYLNLRKPWKTTCIVERSDSQQRSYIGIETSVCMVCPQAQASIWAQVEPKLRNLLREDVNMQDLRAILPIASHNQWSLVKLFVEVPIESRLDPKSLLDVIESNVSSTTYEFLKRGTEGTSVAQAHFRSMFVEDSMRSIFRALASSLSNWPDDLIVKLEFLNFESIYEYQLQSYTEISLGALREAIHSAQDLA